MYTANVIKTPSFRAAVVCHEYTVNCDMLTTTDKNQLLLLLRETIYIANNLLTYRKYWYIIGPFLYDFIVYVALFLALVLSVSKSGPFKKHANCVPQYKLKQKVERKRLSLFVLQLTWKVVVTFL